MPYTTYPNEAAWLEARRTSIGASESAAILGASPYDSPLSLYAKKLGLEPPQADDPARDLRLKLGLLLEPTIAKLYASDNPEAGTIVAPEPFTVYTHDALPSWMTCTPDRLEFRGGALWGVVELKNVDVRLNRMWTDEPPLAFQIQVQHQMAVVGVDHAVVAALIGGNHFRWALVERDDVFISSVLLPALKDFWGRLQSQTPPEVDGTERTRDALKMLYPEPTPGTAVPLGWEVATWDEKRMEAEEKLKAAEADKREAEAHIIQAIGANEFGVFPNGVSYSYKMQHRKESVVKASSYRVLRRSAPKEA